MSNAHISPMGDPIEPEVLVSLQHELRDLGGPGSGNFGHEGRPGEVGGSGPGGGDKEYPSPATVESWGHPSNTLTPAGDELGLKGVEPEIGKPFIVYRLGRKEGGIEGKNAGNAEGVADYISRTQDSDSPQMGGGSGDHITAYQVTVNEPFDEYISSGMGKGAREGSRVGREAEPYKEIRGGEVIYSFAKGGPWSAHPVGSVSLKDVEDAMGTDFGSSGTLKGAETIRSVFAGKRRGLASRTTPLHAAADARVSRLMTALRYAFAKGQAALGRPPNAERAAEAVENALKDLLVPGLLATYRAGGEIAAKQLATMRTAAALRTAKGPKTEVRFRFDSASQEAIDWADRHAAELVTSISETTRDEINNAIAGLLDSGDWEDAYDDILAAVGDERRAELIARHETMTAASEGQREAWDQAVDAGLLTGDESRTWIVTPDDKLCPICESLDGQRVGLTDVYVDSDGEEYDGPPAHVQCRCTEGLA